MNKKEIRLIHDRRKIETYQFFEIFTFNISKKLYKKLKSSEYIYISKKVPEEKDLRTSYNCFYVFDDYKQNKVKVPKVKRIRVSMAVLVSLRYKDKQIFLIEKGSIKPFGGAYEFKEKLNLKSIELDNKESKDLRFTIDIKELDDVIFWWENSGYHNRETTPHREMEEEFCLENPILTRKEFKKYFKDILDL